MELDAAQRALLAAVPTARSEAVPIGGAIDDFLAGLERADALMPAWRTSSTEKLWVRCAEAIGAARHELGRFRDEGGESLGFEALIIRLADVIAPLDEFANVAPEIQRLR